jgi:hypothetical protein
MGSSVTNAFLYAAAARRAFREIAAPGMGGKVGAPSPPRFMRRTDIMCSRALSQGRDP